MRVRADTVFYQIGKIAWIPFTAFGFWFAGYGYHAQGELLSCSLRRISGIPCPGCGGTRAFYYLFLGEFAKSFQYHPAVLYGVFAYAHFMGFYFFRKHISKTKKTKEIQIPCYIYGAAAVILLQWFLKLFRITEMM
jgi:hypothetical protein